MVMPTVRDTPVDQPPTVVAPLVLGRGWEEEGARDSGQVSQVHLFMQV